MLCKKTTTSQHDDLELNSWICDKVQTYYHSTMGAFQSRSYKPPRGTVADFRFNFAPAHFGRGYHVSMLQCPGLVRLTVIQIVIQYNFAQLFVCWND